MSLQKVTVFLVCAAAVLPKVAAPAALAGQGPVGDRPPDSAVETAALSRDAVWRRIFARPETPAIESAAPVLRQRIALGRRLFTDKRLSARQDRSCATCHHPDRGFAEPRAKALGSDGKPLRRHTPTLWNIAFAKRLFWDGRIAALEEQAATPIATANELGATYPVIVNRLSADANMRDLFAEAFPGQKPITSETIATALASYQRTLVSPKTRFDSWVEGDESALSAIEKQGLALFVGKAGCVACHGGWRFTDDRLHDIGLSAEAEEKTIEKASERALVFKTPTLRQVAKTAPYMHNGTLATLSDVLDHYQAGIDNRPSVSPSIVQPLKLTPRQRQALLAFLKTL